MSPNCLLNAKNLNLEFQEILIMMASSQNTLSSIVKNLSFEEKTDYLLCIYIYKQELLQLEAELQRMQKNMSSQISLINKM